VATALTENYGHDADLVGQALDAVREAAINGELDRFFLDLPQDTLTSLGQKLAPAPPPPKFSQTPIPSDLRRVSAQIVEVILSRIKDFVMSHPRRDKDGWLGPER